MKLIVQRVKQATVIIDKKIYGEINQGLLVFLGIHIDDTIKDAKYLAQKLVRLRIFEDNNNKMNLSIKDLNLQVMIISQFTLYGNCSKGNRPSFTSAAKPKIAESLYKFFINEIKNYKISFKTGKFGAEMKVNLINYGPSTFILES